MAGNIFKQENYTVSALLYDIYNNHTYYYNKWIFIYIYVYRCVVLGMGDGSMTTLTIADPEKDGIRYTDGNFSIFLKLTKKGITFSIV